MNRVRHLFEVRSGHHIKQVQTTRSNWRANRIHRKIYDSLTARAIFRCKQFRLNDTVVHLYEILKVKDNENL